MIEMVELDVTAEGRKSQADVEIKETDGGCLEGDLLFCLFLRGCWIRLKKTKKPKKLKLLSGGVPSCPCCFVYLLI